MLNHRLRKSYHLLVCIIPIVVLLLSPSISFADADRIFKENSKAVVVVITYDKDGKALSQGSGFIVRADGAIVTNYHVISNAIDIKTKAGDKVLDVEGLIHTDKENDLVILKVKGEGFPTVKLGDMEKANIGEKVYVISSPEGLENTISDGILSGIRDIEGTNKKILQITAPVSKGSSGGAVFNKDGEVIGVATFLIEEAQNLNFAMPANLIKDKISSKKVTALKDSEIEDYKKTAEYWFYIGVAYSKLDMWKEATEAFKQTIRIEPDHAETHYNLGTTYVKLDMYEEVVEAFKQAIRIEPDFAKAHFGLGVVYDNLGMHKEAVEAYKQAIRIKPDFADVAHYQLGSAYARLRMYREATEAYKEAIRVKPDYVNAHYNLGLIYLILNDGGSALEEYKILKDLDPEMANKLFNLIYK